MTQPKALRLAEQLEAIGLHGPVAAELRRLHQLALDQQGEIYGLQMARSMEQKTAALKAEELDRCKATCAATAEAWREDAEEWKVQRDALLEALKSVVSMVERHAGIGLTPAPNSPMAKARAAIATVEGKKT